MEKLYQKIYQIRLIEEKIAKLYSKEIFRCPVHLAIGHEGSAVGVCSVLTKKDKVFSYHRSHHHYLAKNGSPKKLFWELLGDSRGCSAGRGGSTHLYAPEVGFMGSSAIIGNILPVATGYAHGEKMQKSSNIVVVFCGDATPEEGVFFESINLACLWNLPILFVIEDNNLSCYTPKKVRQSYNNLKNIKSLFDINYLAVDGSLTSSVQKSTSKIVALMKKNKKPGLLHISVFRALEHCGPENDDPLVYRNIKNQWPQKDPLFRLKKVIPLNKILKIEKSINKKLSLIFKECLGPYGQF